MRLGRLYNSTGARAEGVARTQPIFPLLSVIGVFDPTLPRSRLLPSSMPWKNGCTASRFRR
jgi:hypothetical protein